MPNAVEADRKTGAVECYTKQGKKLSVVREILRKKTVLNRIKIDRLAM